MRRGRYRRANRVAGLEEELWKKCEKKEGRRRADRTGKIMEEKRDT